MLLWMKFSRKRRSAPSGGDGGVFEYCSELILSWHWMSTVIIVIIIVAAW